MTRRHCNTDPALLAALHLWRISVTGFDLPKQFQSVWYVHAYFNPRDPVSRKAWLHTCIYAWDRGPCGSDDVRGPRWGSKPRDFDYVIRIPAVSVFGPVFRQNTSTPLFTTKHNWTFPLRRLHRELKQDGVRYFCELAPLLYAIGKCMCFFLLITWIRVDVQISCWWSWADVKLVDITHVWCGPLAHIDNPSRAVLRSSTIVTSDAYDPVHNSIPIHYHAHNLRLHAVLSE